MSSFEWMELQTLTSDINASRTRLATARANKDNRLARVLEQEITAAEKRRDRLLAHITTHLADVPEGAPKPEAAKDPEPDRKSVPVEEKPAQATEKRPVLELLDPIVESAGGHPAARARKADSVKGGNIVWNQLTPGDLERAKKDLAARRAEMLAKHAEELKALDTDQNELDGLEQAIDSFLRRFGQADGAVVVLGEERETRLQQRA